MVNNLKSDNEELKEDNINDSISYLLLEEKEYQEKLESLKENFEEKLQQIDNQYKKEFEKLKNDWDQNMKNIYQKCEKEISEIENNFKIKLEKEIKKMEEEWSEKKNEREEDFLKTILSKEFYD
jgi:exonuclease VII large subunit